MVPTGGQIGRKGIRLGIFLNVIYGNKVMSVSIVGGVSTKSRNGAPSRKGCVVTGQMTKASNE